MIKICCFLDITVSAGCAYAFEELLIGCKECPVMKKNSNCLSDCKLSECRAYYEEQKRALLEYKPKTPEKYKNGELGYIYSNWA